MNKALKRSTVPSSFSTVRSGAQVSPERIRKRVTNATSNSPKSVGLRSAKKFTPMMASARIVGERDGQCAARRS